MLHLVVHYLQHLTDSDPTSLVVLPTHTQPEDASCADDPPHQVTYPLGIRMSTKLTIL